MKRTVNQNKIIHSLLSKHNMLHLKSDLANSFSNGRTEHTSELSLDEAKELIQYLNGLGKEPQKTEIPSDYQTKQADKMRKKILHICYLIGWTFYSERYQRDCVDYNRLKAWLLKYGYLHKQLKDYKYNELPELVTQFENLALTAKK